MLEQGHDLGDGKRLLRAARHARAFARFHVVGDAGYPERRLAAAQRLDHLRPNVAAQCLQDPPAVERVALLARFFLEQGDEAIERNLAAFHFRPRIAVGIARIEAADEVLGQAGLAFVAVKCLEGAAENDPAEIPQDGEGVFCKARIHGGATVFTLFLPQSALI
jgi:hypothetical protein